MVTSLLLCLIATAIIIEPQLCVRSYSCIHGVYYLWWKVCLFNNMNTSWVESLHICMFVRLCWCSPSLIHFSFHFVLYLCNMVKHITKYEFVSFIPSCLTYISFSLHFPFIHFHSLRKITLFISPLIRRQWQQQ